MNRIMGDTVEEISMEEAEASFRRLRTAVEEVNCIENCTEKVATAMKIFGRCAPDVLAEIGKI